MEFRLLHTVASDEAASDDAAPIAELSRVALVKTVDDASGLLPKGSSGTIVSVYGGGVAYCVEFTEPFPALLTIEREDLEPLPDETREHFIASSKNLLRGSK